MTAPHLAETSPGAWHCTACGHEWQAGYDDALASLADRAGYLCAALAVWSGRDDTRPQPEARRAANTAMDAVDAMLGELHALRSRLLGEIRASDDARAARVDAMLGQAGGGE